MHSRCDYETIVIFCHHTHPADVDCGIYQLPSIVLERIKRLSRAIDFSLSFYVESYPVHTVTIKIPKYKYTVAVEF